MTVDYSNFWHPSFIELLDHIPERGMYSPYAYVTYQLESHDHAVQLGDGKTNFLLEGGSLEEASDELVQAIERCNPDRHNGHGQKHTFDPNDVFSSALEQLQTRQYDCEHVYMRWQQWTHRKWGGPMPAAVVLPSDNKWKLLIPNEMGDPIERALKPEAIRDLSDIIPMPDSSNSEKAAIGHYRKRRWSPERRLRHLSGKGL